MEMTSQSLSNFCMELQAASCHNKKLRGASWVVVKTDVNHLAFSVAKVLQKATGTLGQVPIVGCQPGGLRMHVWFKWIKWGLPATYCLKQEVVLLYQDPELRAKRSLSRLASRDFAMSGKFSPLPAK